jgi:outer membrane protein insertion porin family
VLAGALLACYPVAAGAQATLCDQPVPPPAQLPPTDIGPVVYYMGVCFSAQGNASAVDAEAYLFHTQLRPSRPSAGEWVPFDELARETILEDFKRLWATHFLEDLRIEATDYLFANGVVGKLITYHLEERERVKVITYEGSSRVNRGTIDEALGHRAITPIRADSFLDQAVIARVKTVVRDMMADRGFANAIVTHTVTAVAGGSKQVNLTFHVSEGPKLALRDVEFVGNVAVPDDALAGVMKGNRAQNLWSYVRGGGNYNASRFAEDAQALEDYYHDRGYIRARVAQPELRSLDDSPDGVTRWIQLRVPITEGRRYRLGTLTFEGNTLVTSDALQAIFDPAEGEWYSQSDIRKGLERTRQVYGAIGYIEFTGFPDLTPRDSGDLSTPAPANAKEEASEPPIVDVVLRITEGPRYFVNRITFTGNTTTHDSVIRREMRIAEGGVFDTEALKNSVRRLNQLGYFKPLQGNEQDVKVDKIEKVDNVDGPSAVDVTLRLEEQNRNQLQFGAGVSQFDGLFANVSFTTSNFMGRGETVTLTGQRGARSSMYQLAFSKPYLFNRPLSGGFDLFSRKVDYLTGTGIVGYSEVRAGVNVTGGYAVFPYSRVYLGYGYEVIDTAIGEAWRDLSDEAANGTLALTAYLDEGRHIESRITPSFVHNTVDNPFTPRSGRKITVTAAVSGGLLGGSTNYVRPEFEAIQYVPHTSRTALGLRVNSGWLRPFGDTATLPYYLRYFLGGETHIRGVDIRTVGPVDAQNRALGGDKFVLFNAEYYLDIARSVRVLAFHDAGQAFSESQSIDLRQLRTSSGVELRVFIPVLNVPLRLIQAWNIYRDVFQPARAFKVAVGTTF